VETPIKAESKALGQMENGSMSEAEMSFPSLVTCKATSNIQWKLGGKKKQRKKTNCRKA